MSGADAVGWAGADGDGVPKSQSMVRADGGRTEQAPRTAEPTTRASTSQSRADVRRDVSRLNRHGGYRGIRCHRGRAKQSVLFQLQSALHDTTERSRRKVHNVMCLDFINVVFVVSNHYQAPYRAFLPSSFSLTSIPLSASLTYCTRSSAPLLIRLADARSACRTLPMRKRFSNRPRLRRRNSPQKSTP